MKVKYDFFFFFIAFIAIIGALIIIAINEAGFNISQVLLMVALVLITYVYASRTAEIAKATKEQAETSVKMAEATDRSVRKMDQPILYLSVLFSKEELFNKMTIHTRFKNIGRGPAIHPTAVLHHPYFEYDSPLPETILEIGKEIKLNIDSTHKEPSLETTFELIAYYQDIYGRKFQSRLTHDEHGIFSHEYKEEEK